MTPSLALAATITGTLLTLAPIQPADIRAAHQTIDPDAPMWMDPDVAWQLDRLASADREIARHTAYLTAIDWHYDYATRNYFAWLDNARQVRREIEEWLADAYGVEPRDILPDLAAGRAVCEHCLAEMDADELQPDHNGDKTCTDCLSSWEGQPDTVGGFTFAYAR